MTFYHSGAHMWAHKTEAHSMVYWDLSVSTGVMTDRKRDEDI